MRNFFHDDPLIDWLEHYGTQNGYEKDPPEAEKYHELIRKKGQEFENKVYKALKINPRLISAKTDLENEFEKVKQQLAEGVNVIAQAVLINYSEHTYGISDLLVSKDWFLKYYPQYSDKLENFDGYLIGEIKFKKAETKQNGRFGFDKKTRMIYGSQLKTYIDALKNVVPVFDEGFVLVRDPPPLPSRRGSGTAIFLPFENELENKISEAVKWLKKIRTQGKNLYPGCCSEMYPNMNNKEDYPWHFTKKKLAEELDELTRITEISIEQRKRFHDLGIFTGKQLAKKVLIEQDQSILSIISKTPGSTKQQRVLSVLKANYYSSDDHTYIPRNPDLEELWVDASPAEFFVDFETFSSVNDDFSRFPEPGGTPMIYMIGCGDVIGGKWKFQCFVAEKETHEDEKKIFSDFYEYLQKRSVNAGVTLEEATIFHWAPHERTETRNAAERHDSSHWNDLNWVDLGKIVKDHPIQVKGAYNYRLKSIAKALHSLGKIETVWEEGGLGDGLTAMTLSWEAYQEARQKGISILEVPVMQEVIKYNEIDCKTTWEILKWMRSLL